MTATMLTTQRVRKRTSRPRPRTNSNARGSIRRWLRRLTLGLLLAASTTGGFLGGDAVFTSNFFALHQPVFCFDQPCSANLEKVRRFGLHHVLQPWLGQNIYFLDTAALRASLEQHPDLAHTTIRRVFPNTLVIHIVEEQPVALLLQDGALYLVNAQGKAYKKAKPSSGKDLPVISACASTLERGECLRKALEAVTVFKAARIVHLVSELGVEAERLRIVFTDLEYPVYFALPLPADSITRLNASRSYLGTQKTRVFTVDLSYPGKAVARTDRAYF